MKRFLAAAAALVAAAAVLTLPPARLALATTWDDGSIAGLFHVHTNRSDGRSSPDEIAAAAARAGLKFVVFTDHGDGTRPPEPPTYRSGVLCLDGIEISTANGHYIAFDMGAAPYPLGGEARDVIEDVRRLGGFGIAAHPDSPKSELRWEEWNEPTDGLEMINPDTSWRVYLFERGWAGRWGLLRALLTYPWRPSETIAGLLTLSPSLEARWSALAGRRRVVRLAGVDAHARLELRAGDPGEHRFSLPFPGYEPAFRTLSVHVTPTEPLDGDPVGDARRIADGVRRGHLYTAIDAWARPPRFQVTATSSGGRAQPGDELAAAGPLTLRVLSNAPAGAQTIVWRGQEQLARSPGGEATLSTDGAPGVYRVEIHTANTSSGRPSWLTSNPVYVRSREGAPRPRPSAPLAQRALFDGRSTFGWLKEHDATSLSIVEAVQMVSGMELRLRYGLAGGGRVGQYAGAAVETEHGIAGHDRISLAIRAEQPMRVSLQLRTQPINAAPDRWQRSVYADAVDRAVTVLLDDMRPVNPESPPHPKLADVRAVMIIVDTTNSKPGASGRIWLKDVRLEGPR